MIDLDIQAFYRHRAVGPGVPGGGDGALLAWVMLYVRRWLKAPAQQEDGTLVERGRGTPQGLAVSPVLANLLYALRV